MGINEIKNTFPEGSYVKTSFKVIDDKTGDLVDCNCVFLVDHYGEPDDEYVIDAEVAYSKYGIDGDGVFSYGESYGVSDGMCEVPTQEDIDNLEKAKYGFDKLNAK